MDIDAELSSIKNRMAIMEAEIDHLRDMAIPAIEIKLKKLTEAKKILTEVMMNLVADKDS